VKPRALNFFCGAGGATLGLQLAGFHVTGVDFRPQPRHVGDAFQQAAATTFPLDGFDFIWARRSGECTRRIEDETMDNIAENTQDGIQITDWTARGAGLYRFMGSDPLLGGFYADARLEYRAGWRVTVQSTNYGADPDRLAGLIGAFAEQM
jgi:hypothetical protein